MLPRTIFQNLVRTSAAAVPAAARQPSATSPTSANLSFIHPVNILLTMFEDGSSVLFEHSVREGEAVAASSRWPLHLPSGGVGAMYEKLDKVQPEVNMLAGLASTIVSAFAVGLPMAVAIIWFCS